MEKVVHKVRDDTETFRSSSSVVAVRCEFARLKTIECLALLRVQIWAVVVEPFNRLFRNLVAMGVVCKLERAMRYKIREDERRWLVVGGTSGL